MINPDALLTPISEDAPSGEDLEYDPDFTALEMAAKPSEERVIGDSVIPAQPPNHEEVVTQAIALLGRTHDLRVAVLLGNALLATGALGAFVASLRYIEGALRDHWDSVHPQLDEDDGDPTMRVNAVLALASRDELLQSLRQTPLIQSRAFGRVSLRDMEYASGDVTPPPELDTVPDSQTIGAAFQDAGAETVGEVQSAIAAADASVRQIAQILDARVGVDAPDLDPLLRMLGDIQRRIGVFGGSPVPDGATNETPDEGRAPAVLQAPAGAITSPQDVKAALERIMAYYARYEPSSPLPILLDRAKRLVGADFVTIMKDMAPLGVENIALIGGFEPNEGDEGTY